MAVPVAQFEDFDSASTGLDDPTVWDRTAVFNLDIPSAIGANGTGSKTPMAARTRPTLSATSGSTRPGVCCSSRLPRMK